MTLLEDQWTEEDHAQLLRDFRQQALDQWLAAERTDEDWRVAYHEAGHAIAAVLCGSQWAIASIVPEDEFLGYVDLANSDDLDDRDFFLWAGPYAESRHTGVPVADVLAGPTGAYDMVCFRGPVHDDWHKHIDLAWHLVEQFAARLIESGTLLAGRG